MRVPHPAPPTRRPRQADSSTAARAAFAAPVMRNDPREFRAFDREALLPIFIGHGLELVAEGDHVVRPARDGEGGARAGDLS